MGRVKPFLCGGCLYFGGVGFFRRQRLPAGDRVRIGMFCGLSSRMERDSSIAYASMSVTNAISGIIILRTVASVTGQMSLATYLGIAAILVASINVFGGFIVTQRMLKMFRK